MSKQVDFYVIENKIADARYKLASRLSNKLLKLQKRTLLVTDDSESLAQLDHWLWSFSGTSFVAHEPVSENMDACLIHIGESASINQDVLQNDYDVMINLCADTPTFSHHFSRIAEIIEPTDAQKNAGRLRYKHYQSEGFEIKTHPLEL